MTKPTKMTSAEFEAAREARTDQPYAPDWLVSEVTDNGPGHYYRYHVTGTNLSVEPGGYMRNFSHSVPKLSWRYFMAAESVQVAS